MYPRLAASADIFIYFVGDIDNFCLLCYMLTAFE